MLKPLPNPLDAGLMLFTFSLLIGDVFWVLLGVPSQRNVFVLSSRGAKNAVIAGEIRK